MMPFFQTLLDASVRILMVAAVVGFALLVGRVRAGSLRHKAWLAVLCAMLVMPFLPRMVPSFEVPVAAGVDLSEPARVEDAPPIVERATVKSSAPIVLQEAPVVAAQKPIWPAVAAGLYLAGVVAMLVRLAAGWVAVRRVLRQCAAVTIQGCPAYESRLVSTPLTVGLRAPKIVFPMEWREWPEDKVRAVLAHEGAHVERHDTAIGFLAQLNRCVFWFHPLAWWLVSELAATAEQSCDDAGVRAVGESRKYAEVLLDMAEAVRRRGNRLQCPGAGVDGTGMLGRRIDRILRNAPVPAVTAKQRVVVAVSCGLAILAAAGCREKSIFTAELKPDPEYAAMEKRNQAARDLSKAVKSMDAQQAADLEAVVEKNPEDMESWRKLMVFYQTTGKNLLGREKVIAAFRAHKIWMIEHHPEAAWVSLMNPFTDREGYEREKKLWLAAVAKKDAPAAVLVGAERFFEDGDPRLAEELLQRARAVDPATNYTQPMADLYGRVLSRKFEQGDPRAAYAEELRGRLAQSNDSELLAATGFRLALGRSDLGRSYLERALQLDPNSQAAQRGLGRLRDADSTRAMTEKVGREPSEEQYQKVSALPEDERFRYLPALAENAYIHGDWLEAIELNRPWVASVRSPKQTGSVSAADVQKMWDLARRYAQEALRLAPRFTSDPTYGVGYYKANMTLGMIAMRVDGDKRTATKYLLAASRTPSTDGSIDQFTVKLAVLLLKYGGPEERRAVVEYLERYGSILHRKDLDLLQAAKQIRAGYMPIWYQYQSVQLK